MSTLPHATTAAATVELPTDQVLVLKVIPMPGDCNANGDIFGGWVMAQVDLAGSVLPARYTQGRMATVAVNEFIFKQPVRVATSCPSFPKWHALGAPRLPSKWKCLPNAFARRALTSK